MQDIPFQTTLFLCALAGSFSLKRYTNNYKWTIKYLYLIYMQEYIGSLYDFSLVHDKTHLIENMDGILHHMIFIWPSVYFLIPLRFTRIVFTSLKHWIIVSEPFCRTNQSFIIFSTSPLYITNLNIQGLCQTRNLRHLKSRLSNLKIKLPCHSLLDLLTTNN